MATAIESKQMTERPRPADQVPALRPPRLPYHPAVQERFGIDRASWKALVEAIFPTATEAESVILALSYCRARRLDPFKRNVHIVPIWNKDQRRYVDTIWPGIGELRTTAFRTGEYGGRGETVFGPDVTRMVGKLELTFPEWAQVTVQRFVKAQLVPFCGPRVYWLETYAEASHNDPSPNSMWSGRPRGQLDKCAEAAALRAAFPEEIGGEYIPEEVQHGQQSNVVDARHVETIDDLTLKLTEGGKEEAPTGEPTDGQDAGQNESDVPPSVAQDERKPDGPTMDMESYRKAFEGCTKLSEVSAMEAEFAAQVDDTDSRNAIAELAEKYGRQRIRDAYKQTKNGNRPA